MGGLFTSDAGYWQVARGLIALFVMVGALWSMMLVDEWNTRRKFKKGASDG